MNVCLNFALITNSQVVCCNFVIKFMLL